MHIRRDGDESIAHLCLPATYGNSLLRQNVRRISQVRDLVESGAVGELMMVRGNVGQREIKTALTDFDRLLEESQKSQS